MGRLARIGALAAAGLSIVTGTSAAQRPIGVAGTWHIVTARVDYDTGGDDFVAAPNSGPPLLISPGGLWRYGKSHGTWSIAAIVRDDWQAWAAAPYGPTRKLVLHGWPGAAAEGPIEETGGRATYVWVIHHASKPTVPAPGQLHLKLSR